MATVKVTKENFSQVLASNVPVLVDFWAPWCGPCRMVGPVLEQIANEVGNKAVVGKINVDEQPELASRYGVMSIPTISVFKNGQQVSSVVGVRSAQDIRRMLGV